MPRGISRYDEAAFQGRLWTPADKSISLGVWFDGADLSSISHGTSGISQWNDKSGNNLHATQATDANRPTLKVNAYNGLSAVTFGNSLWLGSSLSASSASEAIFAVINTSASVTGTILGADSSGGRQFRTESTDQLGFIKQEIVNLGSTGAGNTFNKNRLTLVYLEYNSTGNTFYSDGAILGTTTFVNPSLTAGKTTTISKGAGGIENFVGDIAEIIVFQGDLRGFLRQKIEGYLAYKWGFADKLKADHRYLSRPPMIGD
jgi:hypothetical protein